MIEQFLNHIERHTLCKTNDKILLAVSGGVDSMVMMHLFLQAGFSVAVAHCNFQLRGEASMADEAHVNSFCIDHNIPFHSRRFDTASVAASSGESIQMTARRLRYGFFQDIMVEFGYDCLATAHHLDDNLETMILNLTRGTGIDGLAGIPVKTGNIVRPLLFASRQKIEDYAAFHRIAWREDESNATDDYNRNHIRHHVVPRLIEVNPGLYKTFGNTIERIRFSRDLTQQYVDEMIRQYCRTHKDQLHIDKKLLEDCEYPDVILWEILKPKGFNFEQCKLLPGIHAIGKQIFSSDHSLTLDREALIVAPLEQHAQAVTISEETLSGLLQGVTLQFKRQPIGDFTLSGESTLAQLDFSRVRFPLSWRKWQPGDSFKPLGMSQTKKVSDFLIDKKIAVPDKERITVLESAGEIIWVVGLRIDDRYKVTQKTSEVLIIEAMGV